VQRGEVIFRIKELRKGENKRQREGELAIELSLFYSRSVFLSPLFFMLVFFKFESVTEKGGKKERMRV